METILIATDFSPAADAAVRYGANLAKYFGARIVLVHAWNMPIGGYDSLAPHNIAHELRVSAEGALEQVKKDIMKQLAYEPEIITVAEMGSANGTISAMVNHYDAQAVVVGMTGSAGGLKRHVFGSVALEATRNVTVPLFVIPEKCNYRPIRKIIFACDYDHTEQTILPHITKYLAKVFDADVEILHIKTKEEEAVAVKRSVSAIKKVLAAVRHELLTLEGEHIGETIRSYIEENDCDLLMLNPKEHGFFQRLFHPPLTKELIFSVHRPMLFVRA